MPAVHPVRTEPIAYATRNVNERVVVIAGPRYFAIPPGIAS
jgi:hypothetical protein